MKTDNAVDIDTEIEDAADETPIGGETDHADIQVPAIHFGSDKTIDVKDLPIGSKLDYSIWGTSNNLLLNSSIVITDAIVNGMIRRGITEVILKSEGRKADPVEAYKQEIKALQGKPDREFYESLDDVKSPANITLESRETALSSFETIVNIVAENERFDVYELQDNCEKIIKGIGKEEIAQPSVTDIYLADLSLGHHCINVVVTFAQICSALNVAADNVREYIAAAILHDIGKVILDKVARSDEKKELVKGKAIKEKFAKLEKEKGIDINRMHAEVAYRYLQNMGGITDGVLNAVRNHHERIDGKGYPHGVNGEDLGDLDQALAVANFYEKLTWDSSKELKAGQCEAVKSIIQQSGRLADCKIVSAFLNVFGHFPPGSWVKLNSGETALVVQSIPHKPREPLVHIYFDKDGNRLKDAIPLNLSEPGAPHIVKYVNL